MGVHFPYVYVFWNGRINVIKFRWNRQEGCTTHSFAEGSFKKAGEAGDKDLPADTSYLKHFNVLSADDIWTEWHFVFFLSGAKWFSTINKADDKVKIYHGLFSFKIERRQKFSTEIGYFSVKTKKMKTRKPKKKPKPNKQSKDDDGKTYLGVKCTISITCSF